MTTEELETRFRAAIEPHGHRYTEEILQRAETGMVMVSPRRRG